MCRFLIAIGGYPPEDALEDFVAISRRDRTMGWSHGSGWGMLWLRRGEVGVYRSVKAIWESFVPLPVATTYMSYTRAWPLWVLL